MSQSHFETQTLRLQAIEEELRAVSAQSAALGHISVEHHDGINLGTNCTVAYFETRAQALVKSLKELLERLPQLQEQERELAVGEFKQAAMSLHDDSEHLIKQRDAQAVRHLKDVLGDGDGSLVGVDLTDEKNRLNVEAHVHCHAAETSEIRSYVMQLRALSNLCMETACVGIESAVS